MQDLFSNTNYEYVYRTETATGGVEKYKWKSDGQYQGWPEFCKLYQSQEKIYQRGRPALARGYILVLAPPDEPNEPRADGLYTLQRILP